MSPRLPGLRAGVFVPSARFFVCLKQDGQDLQDLQDEAAGTPRKGLEDLHVYRTSAQRPEKVWKTLMSPSRARFFVCLNQDEQDEQDFQDGAAQAYGRKVR